MTWVRLDDRFHRNPKQLQLSDGAFRVWVCSWSYCAEEKQLTGFMTTAQAQALVRTYGKPLRVIQELVDANAWEQLRDGYLIHDFEDYLDRGSAERTRKWRSEKRFRDQDGGNGDVTPPSQVTSPWRHGDSHGDAAVTHSSHARRVIPVPDPVKTPDVPSVVLDSQPAPSASGPPAPEGEWTLPSGVQIQNLGNGALAPTAEELTLVKRYLEITGNHWTASDVIKAREFLGELLYLGVEGMAESIERHVKRRREANEPWPRSLGGFWKILRSDNDYARDHGSRERVGVS